MKNKTTYGGGLRRNASKVCEVVDKYVFGKNYVEAV